MSMYSADELRERVRTQNRETILDPMMARAPVPSAGARRFSEGKYGGRPLSRHGKRPTSSRSLDSPLPPSNMSQASQHRLHSHQTPSCEGSSLLRRHTTEDIMISTNEQEFSGMNASFVPRPPSRHRTESRPKSAKGRVRPSSQVGREGVLSRENLQCVGEQVPFPPPLKSQSSFSKYKLLPSIGKGHSVEQDSDQSSLSYESLVKRTNDNKDNTLLKKTAGLSLYTLPDEPKDTEPERIHLAVKLLDGSRHERWFRQTDTVGAVLAFAESFSEDKLPPCQFCTNEVPRRVFNNFSMSLTEAGIISRTVLYLEDIV